MIADNYRQVFKSVIARIYHCNGAVVGAGFLVTESHLLTCAHVVTAALGISTTTTDAPTDSIELDFPLIALGDKSKAKVVFWQPVNPGQVGEDIAGLKLESSPPKDCQLVRLVSTTEFWKHPFQIFGFPSQRDDGIWASGELRDQIGTGWVQMEDIKAPGYAVELGFSGAPVWDEQLEGVVGMVVAAERKREDAKAAFMIPTSILGNTWRQLTPVTQPTPAPVTRLSRTQQVKVKRMEERLNSLLEDAKAAHNQLDYTLGEVDRNRIKRQIGALDQEIDRVAAEIDALTQGVGL